MKSTYGRAEALGHPGTVADSARRAYTGLLGSFAVRREQRASRQDRCTDHHAATSRQGALRMTVYLIRRLIHSLLRADRRLAAGLLRRSDDRRPGPADAADGGLRGPGRRRSARGSASISRSTSSSSASWRDLARGDFGMSIWQGVPAMSLVLSRFPATVYLSTGGGHLLAVRRPADGRRRGRLAALGDRPPDHGHLGHRRLDADLLAGADADHRLRRQPELGQDVRLRRDRVPDPAGAGALGGAHRTDRPGRALVHAGRAEQAVRHHRPLQGPARGTRRSCATRCATPPSRSSP